MGHDNTSAPAQRPAVSKLFRVLVLGGVALAGTATCTQGNPPGKQQSSSGDGGASSSSSGGGIRGW